MDEISGVELKNGQPVEPAEDKDFTKPQEAMTVSPSLKLYLHKIALWIFLLYVALLGLSRVTEKGARIYDLLGRPEVSKTSSKLWLKFLAVHLSEEVASYPLYALAGVSVLMLIYFVLDAKTTKYTVNYRFLEIKKGILNQKVDTIELMKVKDQTLDRPFGLRILGLSKLIVFSNDETHPELNMSGISHIKAQLFLDFLRNNSYNSYTEYRIAKDRQATPKRGRKSRENIIPDGDSDGE